MSGAAPLTRRCAGRGETPVVYAFSPPRGEKVAEGRMRGGQ